MDLKDLLFTQSVLAMILGTFSLVAGIAFYRVKGFPYKRLSFVFFGMSFFTLITGVNAFYNRNVVDCFNLYEQRAILRIIEYGTLAVIMFFLVWAITPHDVRKGNDKL